jgi:UDP-4-amino-4,6-dideoxy-N-acetyl-beta-L-altrosamine N-acetyltransferase
MSDNQITLRDLTTQDLDAVVRWRNDSNINEYLVNREKTLPEAYAWFNRITNSSNNLPKGIYDDNQLIGYCIVGDIDEKNRKCEVGVIIGESRLWGKGIGKTVVTELLKYCFEINKMHRVLAVIVKGNERSERLFKSMGFRYEGTFREATIINNQFTDLNCFSILEHEYK